MALASPHRSVSGTHPIAVKVSPNHPGWTPLVHWRRFDRS